MNSSADDSMTKPKRERSPGYPFISLKAAIERLVQWEGTFGRHPTPADKAGIAWKIKETSSQAMQTLAALKAYGLVQYKGEGLKREVSLSDDARTYLRAQQDSIKQEVLKRAALKPKAFATYWSEWREDRPPDAVCMDRLILIDGFSHAGAKTFLRVYDETIAYAGLVGPDKADANTEQAADKAIASVETMEQATNKGQLTAFTFMPPNMLEGAQEREWLRGPLSKATSYRLLVNGELGPREIGKLIRLLEAQKAVLDDDEDSD